MRNNTGACVQFELIKCAMIFTSAASPLSALGLKSRFGSEEDKDKESNGGGMELNNRGLPARKRKKNSLIFGTDDLVSIPVRSPRKKRDGSAANSRSASASPVKAATPRAKRVREAAATAAAASATITKQVSSIKIRLRLPL